MTNGRESIDRFHIETSSGHATGLATGHEAVYSGVATVPRALHIPTVRQDSAAFERSRAGVKTCGGRKIAKCIT